MKRRFDQIQIENIELNENNPRGIYNPYEDDEFSRLCESIEKFGILIPLIVKEINDNKFLLVDGERRYNAALKTKNEIVPVYIMEDNDIDKTDNYIITMQNIHANRKAWSPGAQHKITEMIQKIIEEEIKISNAEEAVNNEGKNNEVKDNKKEDNGESSGKLDIAGKVFDKKEIKDLNKKSSSENEEKTNLSDKLSNNDLKKKVARGVAKKTGMTSEKAYESVLFSEWPEEIKNEIWSKKGSRTLYSHVISIEKSFVQPLIKHYPKFAEEESLDSIRRKLFIKIKNEVLGPALGYRELSFLFMNLKENNKYTKQLEALFQSFIDVIEEDITQLKAKYYNTFLEDIVISNLSEEEYLYQLNIFIAILNEIDVSSLTKVNSDKAKTILKNLYDKIKNSLSL